MEIDAVTWLFAGAVGLGFVHGIEPGHGWPVAASYAINQSNKWVHGFAASVVLGVGHLVSSIAMVAAFFWAKSYFGLSEVGWLSPVAGVLLIALGIREYRHGRSHSHGHDHDHGHDRADHDSHRGDRDHGGAHDHESTGDDERGLLGIAGFAFVLGFAHEEEFEIIALCTGSAYCLELMAVYALAVIVGIVGFTLLLIAGYQRHEERVEEYEGYLPLLSAVVLVAMGLGFLLGVF